VAGVRVTGFAGTIGCTLDTTVPDWSIVAPVRPPEGAPNLLVVLIDDAGFGGPATFGGEIATPTLTGVRDLRLTRRSRHPRPDGSDRVG
jgi:hypothetical protein